MFCVNWFRKDEGQQVRLARLRRQHARVLKWMIDRIEGQAQGQETMFGVAPQYAEINWTGSGLQRAQQFAT